MGRPRNRVPWQFRSALIARHAIGIPFAFVRSQIILRSNHGIQEFNRKNIIDIGRRYGHRCPDRPGLWQGDATQDHGTRDRRKGYATISGDGSWRPGGSTAVVIGQLLAQ